MIPFIFSLVFPFLLIMAALQAGMGLLGRRPSGWRVTLLLGILSALIALCPLKGISFARWMISINANFSIPLTAIIFSKVLENASGTRVLDSKAFLSSWLFGISACLVLYPMALGLGRFDPYGFGWSFSGLFVLLFVVTVVLLLMKNRFGMVLMACMLAYNLRLLESANLWDYLIDPFMALLSGVALGWRFLLKLLNKGGDASKAA